MNKSVKTNATINNTKTQKDYRKIGTILKEQIKTIAKI